MKRVFILLLAATCIYSCKEDEKGGVFKGPETKIYEGKAWSSVRISNDGTPEQIIFTVNDAALNSVPVGTDMPAEHQHGNEFQVKLHPKASGLLPFDFFLVDWNPNGHPPAGIYDKPHFDFHLYMTSPDEVAGYTDVDKLNAPPAADYLPAGYIPTTAVPLMGRHWMDAASPELHGQLFSQTFVYGSYNSKVVFYEPMITLDFLKTTNNFERNIPQPAKFQKEGYYPTKLRIAKHDGVTDLIFEAFIYRQAS